MARLQTDCWFTKKKDNLGYQLLHGGRRPPPTGWAAVQEGGPVQCCEGINLFYEHLAEVFLESDCYPSQAGVCTTARRRNGGWSGLFPPAAFTPSPCMTTCAMPTILAFSITSLWGTPQTARRCGDASDASVAQNWPFPGRVERISPVGSGAVNQCMWKRRVHLFLESDQTG